MQQEHLGTEVVRKKRCKIFYIRGCYRTSPDKELEESRLKAEKEIDAFLAKPGVEFICLTQSSAGNENGWGTHVIVTYSTASDEPD